MNSKRKADLTVVLIMFGIMIGTFACIVGSAWLVHKAITRNEVVAVDKDNPFKVDTLHSEIKVLQTAD